MSGKTLQDMNIDSITLRSVEAKHQLKNLPINKNVESEKEEKKEDK